jgi:hypothetical protein
MASRRERGALEDCPEWQHDAIRIGGEILESDHYLPLPTEFDLHEYGIFPKDAPCLVLLVHRQ